MVHLPPVLLRPRSKGSARLLIRVVDSVARRRSPSKALVLRPSNKASHLHKVDRRLAALVLLSREGMIPVRLLPAALVRSRAGTIRMHPLQGDMVIRAP
jgi:hypothetical protein